MPTPKELPKPLDDAGLDFPAIHQACADKGVPLKDRYGWAFGEDRIRQAVRAARGASSLPAAVDALAEEMFCNGLELCPLAYDCPAEDAELLAIARILRSPVADEAAS